MLGACLFVAVSHSACHLGAAPKAGTGAFADAPSQRLPDGVAPMNYQVSLQVDPNATHYSGEARILIKVSQPTRTLWLHGQDLQVTEVTLRQAPRGLIGATLTVVPGGLLRVETAEELAAGEYNLSLNFNAAYNSGLRGLYRVAAGDANYVVTQFEPIGARHAFPCFDEPRFKTPFQITLMVPQDVVAISNMPVLGEQTTPGQTQVRVITFEPTPPLPTYLVAVMVGPFDVVNGPVLRDSAVRHRPLPVRGLAVRGKGPLLSAALQRAGVLVEALEDYFGIAFPFPKLDLIAVPDFAAGAMENPGAITFRDWLLLLDPHTATEEQRRVSEYVISHELVHHWFGDDVTMPWWDDLWLNESFATWLGERTVRQTQPTWHTEQERVLSNTSAMSADTLVSARKIRQPVNSEDDILNAFDGITYQKGAAVLSMFENFIGEQKMQEGIARHLHAYEFGNATAPQFLESLQKASGDPNLAQAFDTFLQQTGVPFITADVVCDGQKNTLRLHQSRYQPLGGRAQAGGNWHIPVCYRFEGPTADAIVKRCTMLSEVQQDIPLDHCPRWVMPNADGAGYYRFMVPESMWKPLAGAPLAVQEQLALADSLQASLAAGVVPVHTALPVLANFAHATNRHVAAMPMGMLARLHDGIVSADKRPLVRRLVQNLYGSKLHAMGLVPAAKEAPEVTLWRPALATFLYRYGTDEALKKNLAKKGHEILSRASGAANSDILPLALAAAADLGGVTVVQKLIDQLEHSDDATMRKQWVRALRMVSAKEAAARVRQFALQGNVRENEVDSLIGGQFNQPHLQDATWGWLQENFAALSSRVPVNRRGSLPNLCNSFCQGSDSGKVQEFFNPKVSQAAVSPRQLDQTVESIELCVAQRTAQQKAADAWFSVSQKK